MSILIRGVSLPKNRAMVLVLHPNGRCIDEFGNVFAAEPHPVKEGAWMPIIEGNEYGEAIQIGCYCSQCGEQLQSEPDYCPNCGAKMGGDT